MYDWNGRSLLDVNITPSVSQTLLRNQQIYYTNVDGETKHIDGADYIGTSTTYTPDPRGYYPCCLLSSFSVHSDGSSKIKTQLVSYDESNNKITEYLKLYPFVQFSDLYAGTKPLITTNSNGDMTFVFTPSVQTRKVAINVPTGQYIIPVTVYDSNINVNVKVDNVSLPRMYDKETTDAINSPGVYDLYMNLDDIVNDSSYIASGGDYHVLEISVSGIEYDCSVKLSNCYKYIYPTDTFGFTTDWIEYWINELDTNHIFNYSYQVPSEILIENPLNSQEFFNTNHIYNKFTIGQIQSINIK